MEVGYDRQFTQADAFGDLVSVQTPSRFDDLFTDLIWCGARGQMAQPRINMAISETDKFYRVKADIPGAKKQDIKVSVVGNLVAITAGIKNESEADDGGSFVRSGRFYDQKSGSFTSANQIDSSKACAGYHHGVLELMLPKKEGSNGARHLAIN